MRLAAALVASSPLWPSAAATRRLGELGRVGGELTVSAAASLTDAFAAYGETTEGEERFSFAGSDELAAQIRQGADARRLRVRQHHLSGRALRRGAGRKAGRLHPQPARGRGAGRRSEIELDRRPRRARARPGDRRQGRPGRRLHARGDRRAAGGGGRGDPRQRALGGVRRQGRRRQARPRAPPTPASSTPPTSPPRPTSCARSSCRAKLEPEVSYGIAVVERRREPRAARRTFIDGLLAPEGQQILEDNGFLPARRLRAALVSAPARRRRSAWRSLFLTAADRRDLPPGRARRAGRPARRPAGDRRAAPEPDHLRDRARVDPRLRHARRLPARDPIVSRPLGGDHRDRAAAGPAARGRRDRPARGVRARGAARRRDRGRRRAAGVRDRRRRGRAHLRRQPLLPAPGPGGVRGRRPDLAPGLAHARARARRARSRGSRSRRRCRAWRQGRRSPGAGRWASSGPRWCSPARSRGSRRRRRWRSSSSSAATSPAALALSAVLVAVSAALLLSVKLVDRPRRRVARDASRSSMLRAELAGALGELELEAASRSCPTPLPGAGRAVGRRQVVAAADDRRPGPAAPRPGRVRRAPLARHRGRRRAGARAAPLRLRVPGLRAVRAHERLAQRRLRAARASPRARRRPRRRRAARPLRRRPPRRRPAGDALGRRAPARRPRAGAGLEPERPAARRAALGARRQHAGEGDPSSCSSCSATPRCPPCSSPTTSTRRRRSPTRSR